MTCDQVWNPQWLIGKDQIGNSVKRSILLMCWRSSHIEASYGRYLLKNHIMMPQPLSTFELITDQFFILGRAAVLKEGLLQNHI